MQLWWQDPSRLNFLALTSKPTTLRLSLSHQPLLVNFNFPIAGWTRQPSPQENGSTPRVHGPPVAMNHLLLGKRPLINSKPRKGPHPGAIPAPKNRVLPPSSTSSTPMTSSASERSRTRSTSSTGTTTSTVDATCYTCPQVSELHSTIIVLPKCVL